MMIHNKKRVSCILSDFPLAFLTQTMSDGGGVLSICLCLQVILASGYYAAFRVTLVAKALEGAYDGAIHITTDYEVSSAFCFQAEKPHITWSFILN